MRIANAPCSWGVLEFESTALAPSPAQVLDEIAATGYEGTDLGDWGFFSTDPRVLRAELDRRRLDLVGAFVDIALTNPSAHDAGAATAVRTARLLMETALEGPYTTEAVGEIRATRPMIVLSDKTAALAARTAKAGRITAADGLADSDWEIVATGAEHIARAVLDAAGVGTVFHHHCATVVETPEEIGELMRRTSRELLELCLDTGHATYGGGDPVALLDEYRDRIRLVHFKDCSPEIATRARAERCDYLTAIRHGLFCELGRGQVDFRGILERLRASHYGGWIVVEQDVLPSMGTPAASAARNRQFLRGLGL